MSEGFDDELQQMDEREQDAPTLVQAVHLDDPISSLELQPLTVAAPDASLVDAVKLMETNSVGCILVEENGKLIGILTERDIIRKATGRGLHFPDLKISDYMTRKPTCLRMGDPIAFALNRIYDRGYRHIPIIDKKGKALAFVSSRDIINHLAVYYRNEIQNLPPRPIRGASDREGG
ncbi:CBS domain-containing protein [Candidatus Neomarinimicrobiota bacterium]